MTIAEGEGGADFKAPLGCKPNGMSAEVANDAPAEASEGDDMFSRAGVAAE
jgi:hypothetical protein